MRKVFFSFHYGRDAWRVSQVRNSNVVGAGFVNPYYDRAGWESVKARGDAAIKQWIDTQIRGTSVTVVLVGAQTSTRRWVRYEIQKTLELGHGLIGVDISKVRDQNGNTDSTGANPLPAGHKYYRWNNDDGRTNLGTWIEQAAR